MASIKAICISERKGCAKRPIPSATLVADHGIRGDAHAGKGHRQVSFLAFEKIEAFKQRGALVRDGDFGENIIVEGVDFISLPLGTVFSIGDAVLQLSQHGKECHDHCVIYEAMGECIMPTQGVFAIVLRGGNIAPGDTLTITDIPENAD